MLFASQSCRFWASQPAFNLYGLFRQTIANTSFQYSHHFVDLLVRYRQGRAESQPVRIEPSEQTVLQSAPADADAKGNLGREGFFGRAIADELDSQEKPFAADVADDRVLFHETLEAEPQALAL